VQISSLGEAAQQLQTGFFGRAGEGVIPTL